MDTLGNYKGVILYDEYPIIKKLGEGTYSVVYESNEPDGKLIAIKAARAGSYDGIGKAELNEINALNRLKGCKHVVEIMGLRIKNVEGITNVSLKLSYHNGDMVYFCKTVSTIERMMHFHSIMQQLSEGLYHMHSRGIMHRDIKPQNILIDFEYDAIDEKIVLSPICYLADFGLAHQMECRENNRSKMHPDDMYTLHHRPPELFAYENYSENADVWALGMTLLEYLTKEIAVLHSIYNKIDMLLDNEIASLGIYDIFSLVSPVIDQTPENIELLKGDKLTGTIDVESYLSKYLKPFQIEILHPDDLDKLRGMLEISPSKRIGLRQLITHIESCEVFDLMPQRGKVISPRSNNMFAYAVIDWLAGVTKLMKGEPRVLINAIDLVERYVATDKNLTRENTQLMGIVCYLLSDKMFSIYPCEIADMVFASANAYSAQQIREYEIKILSTMNYMVVSCEYDDYFEVIKKSTRKDKTNLVREFHAYLMKHGIYSGELPYHELIKKFNKFSNT